MKTTPAISIGMSVLNNQRTIAQAVRSIIRQTYTDWELLVFDDGSSDGTPEIVRSFGDPRIRLFQDGKNRGLPARLNEAIAAASGEFFARMDGDDVSYPERLEMQLAFMRSHPEVDLVGGGVLVIDEGGRIVGKRMPPVGHEVICRKPVAGFPLAHPTYFGRTGWFARYGYREAAVRCEDQDLLLRSHEQSHFANIGQIVLGYRETRIELPKILKSRRFLARMLYAEFARRGRLLIGLRGMLEQYAKGAVDAIAVLTGAQHRLLRHRARPVDLVDAARWRDVWASVQQ